NDGSRLRAVSHSFSPPTRRLDCRHNQTCARSRKYQPLATQPCSRGSAPVTNVDWTEQVTAGVIVRSGTAAPRCANAWRWGVSDPSMLGVRPTTSRTSVRSTSFLHARRLTAQDGVPGEQRALVDGERALDVLEVEPPALREEDHGMMPADLLDRGVRNARRAHGRRRLGHLQRIAHAPIRGTVDDDPLRAELLDELDHAMLVHLGVRIDGMPRPHAGVEHLRERLLV